jgi:hypothetical protein
MLRRGNKPLAGWISLRRTNSSAAFATRLPRLQIKPLASTGIATLICLSVVVLGCGSSSPTLTLVPAAEVVTVNLEQGTESGGVQLQALLNGSALPADSVAWSSSTQCLGVNTVGSIGCNPTCGSATSNGGTHFTATVTAAAHGLTAMSSITCQYQ